MDQTDFDLIYPFLVRLPCNLPTTKVRRDRAHRADSQLLRKRTVPLVLQPSLLCLVLQPS